MEASLLMRGMNVIYGGNQGVLIRRYILFNLLFHLAYTNEAYFQLVSRFQDLVQVALLESASS